MTERGKQPTNPPRTSAGTRRCLDGWNSWQGTHHRHGRKTHKELDSPGSRNAKQGEQLDPRQHPVMHPTRGSTTTWAPPLIARATVTALQISVAVPTALPTVGRLRPMAMVLPGSWATLEQAVGPGLPSRRSRRTTAPTMPEAGTAVILLPASREQTL